MKTFGLTKFRYDVAKLNVLQNSGANPEKIAQQRAKLKLRLGKFVGKGRLGLLSAREIVENDFDVAQTMRILDAAAQQK